MLCVLIVEGMSVIVNVMLSLMSLMSPPPALCNLSVRTAVKLCEVSYFSVHFKFWWVHLPVVLKNKFQFVSRNKFADTDLMVVDLVSHLMHPKLKSPKTIVY